MNTIVFLTSLFFTTAICLPHVGMLNTPDVRDVGLIFDGRDFNGTSTFLVETKNNPTCIPINVDSKGRPQGLHIASVQICKPTKCAFFTGESCSLQSTGTFSVSCQGPGDVPNHKSTDLFKSYICGANISKLADVGNTKALVTVPHDPEAGMV